MDKKRRYLLACERKHISEDVSVHRECCVPNQALSIREILNRYMRERKPLPTPVEYDIESMEQQVDALQVPTYVSREDALHLAQKAKSYISKLEYASSEASRLAIEAKREAAQAEDSAEQIAGT